MRVWIDTDSGTWGNAATLRIVDLESTEIVEEDTDVDSILSFLDGSSDSEIADFGLRYGKPVEQEDE